MYHLVFNLGNHDEPVYHLVYNLGNHDEPVYHLVYNLGKSSVGELVPFFTGSRLPLSLKKRPGPRLLGAVFFNLFYWLWLQLQFLLKRPGSWLLGAVFNGSSFGSHQIMYDGSGFL